MKPETTIKVEPIVAKLTTMGDENADSIVMESASVDGHVLDTVSFRIKDKSFSLDSNSASSLHGALGEHLDERIRLDSVGPIEWGGLDR